MGFRLSSPTFILPTIEYECKERYGLQTVFLINSYSIVGEMTQLRPLVGKMSVSEMDVGEMSIHRIWLYSEYKLLTTLLPPILLAEQIRAMGVSRIASPNLTS